MIGGIARWIPVVIVALAAVPVGLVAARWLERSRVRRGMPPPQARRTAWAEVFMVVTTVPWLWMILTPLPRPSRIELVPLVDLVDVLAAQPAVAVAQVGGNLLVFAGFGFLAPIRWPFGAVVRWGAATRWPFGAVVRWGLATRWPAPALAVTLIAGLGSVIVESLQFLLGLGRVASVDDVLLNAVGAGLAALCSRRWWRLQDLRDHDAAVPKSA